MCLFEFVFFFPTPYSQEDFQYLLLIISLVHFYQDYFNMSCHGHMNMCCVITLHVNMLTLFKKLLTKEPMPMQKVRMENAFAFSMWKQLWWSHFNTMHGTQSPFYFYFFCLIDHKLYKFMWFLAIMWILCESYMHKGQERENEKAWIDHRIKDIRIVIFHEIFLSWVSYV
jgi:hypothetical protein